MPHEIDAPSCPTCGVLMIGDEANPKLHKTVTRVVRPNNRYGDALPGTRVEVEKRHVDQPSVKNATMSLADLREAEEKVKEKAKARESIGASRVNEMLDREIAAAEARTRQQIARARAERIDSEAPPPPRVDVPIAPAG